MSPALPDHRVVARGLLALLCIIQGLVTMAIDLSHTHATNPLWPRHARFHLVWQVISTVCFCALEVALLCWRGHYTEQRFYLALVLTCIPLLGFLGALIGRSIYGGALSDPNGIPPAKVDIFGKVHHFDLNVVAVGAAWVAIAAIWSIYSL